ncbi:phBC6A51 family helix-turn-helix protein [Fictibacillus nanhaiensis]|uniref:phBC6A51 family helix-turn-helix protein n=1 Tax=Fictibacillus nanhaiensis TaxID=742169 RepID=UPI00203DE964|nr:phBC6A51 family helix-turn-helix protein [Fictibacillus nanhaiensis]MCM3732744.1 phBC6A51 family helix-turn-helix protein [Fictibacillus nanhaiensis]
MNIRELESHLYADNPKKVKAAHLLVNNDYVSKEEAKTQEEIAEELGVTRQTLYTWRQDPIFLKYCEQLSEVKLIEFRSLVDSQLIKAIKGTSSNGIPSMKALDLYYKLSGRLVERSEVVTAEEASVKTRPLNDKEIERELAELQSKLKH